MAGAKQVLLTLLVALPWMFSAAPAEVAAQSAAVVTLHSFDGTDGHNPYAGVIRGWDGAFYGTTAYGGLYERGTVFRLTPSGTFTRLYSSNVSGRDEAGPRARLVQASNGLFYGTTTYGTTCDGGTVFRMTATGSGTQIHAFCGPTGLALPCQIQ